MTKTKIRQQLLALRKQLDPAQHRLRSEQAQMRLMASRQFRLAEKIALYSPVQNEVSTAALLQGALEQRKAVHYPRVEGAELVFRRVLSVAELTLGAFGVKEPAAGAAVAGSELDLIVVPGAAFDLRGQRLGYGRGFYDRCLARTAPDNLSVGLCFELQIRDKLPAAGHDVAVDFIVTEARLIPVSKKETG
jgi:5-formyltetrahydrofolate cyclo-ligase